MENISENPDEYREYILRRQQTGSEAAHFSFRYTNPAVFDIMKKNTACGILPAIEDCLRGGSRKRHLPFRRNAIHPETEIILLLKSI